MIDLLSPSELVLQITSIKVHDSSQFSYLDRASRSLNPNGSFPTFSYLEIKSFNKLIKSGIDFAVALKKKNFSFRFDVDALKSMMANSNLLENAPDYAIIIGLYSYISWYLRFFENQIIDDLEMILNFLLFIMPIHETKNIQKAHCLSASAFMHLYSDVIESTKLLECSPLFIPLVQFLTMNNDLPNSAFDLVLKTASRVIDPTSTKFTKETSYFVNSVVMIMRVCGARYPQPITTSIVFLLRNILLNFDYDCLSFFGRSLVTLGIDEAIDIVSDFPDAIIKRIEENDPITPFDQKSSAKVMILPSISIKIENKIVDHQTFESEPKIQDIDKLPDFVPFMNLMPQGFDIILDLISKIVCVESKLADLIIEKMNDILIQIPLTKYYYDIIASFFYLQNIISKSIKIDKFPKEILQSRLFSDDNTVFHQKDSFTQINTIREMVLSILFTQNELTFEKCLETFRLSPTPFAELVVRFMPYNIDSSIIEKRLKTVTKEFLKALLYYQQFYNTSPEIDSVINFTRSTILAWIDFVLKVQDYVRVLFSYDQFIDLFLNLLLEIPLSEFVLSHLTKYLVQITQPSEFFYNKFNDVISIVFKSPYKEMNLVLVEKIIDFLNFISSDEISIAKGFDSSIPIICKWVAGLPKNDQAYEILKKTMKLFSSFAKVHLMSHYELSAIETCAKQLLGIEPKDDFMDPLFSLIAGKEITNTQEPFPIKQPKAMRLLLELYENSSTFPLRLKNIKKLLKFSSQNCEQCHKSEFDTYILSKIDKWKNDENFDEKLYNKILEIFYMISSKFCTVSIVQKFISLMCPIEGEHLSRFHFNIMECLQKLINFSKSVPLIPLKLNSDNKITLHGLKTDIILKKFSISCWLYLSSYSKQASIMSFNSQSNFAFSFLLSDHIEFVLFHNLKIYSYSVSKDQARIPLNQWFLLSITFSKQNNNTLIEMYINYEQIKIIDSDAQQLPSFELFSDEDLDVIVGGSPSSEFLLFGPFGLFNENFDIKDEILLSPRFLLGNDKSRIIYLDANVQNPIPTDAKDKNQKQNILLSLFRSSFKVTSSQQTQENNDNKIRAELVKNSISSYSYSFGDILTDRCGVALMIPLLAQVQYTYKNESLAVKQINLFFDILKSSLILSNTSQIRFGLDNGFNIISHLLTKLPDIIFSYSLYQTIYNIFLTLRENNCRTQILSSILLRNDLWLKTTADDHLKILDHWSNVFFPNFFEEITQNINFFQLLAICRVYYWYEMDEITIIKCVNRCRGELLNLDACRRDLYQVLLCYTKDGIFQDYFRFIISQILTVKDAKQIQSLIKLVKFFINNHPENIAVFQPLVLLFYLNFPNEKISKTIFDILIDAHHSHFFIDYKLEQHISLVMHQLPECYVTLEFLKHIVDMCKNNVPQVFPLCMMIAFILGEESVLYVLENITPNSKICSDKYWSLWIIVSIFYITFSNYDETQNLYDFMIKTGFTQWSNIYYMIECLGSAFQIDTSDIKRDYVVRLSEYITQENVNYFYEIVTQYLFCHPKTQINKMLVLSMNSSKNLTLNPTARRLSSSSRRPKVINTNSKTPPIPIPKTPTRAKHVDSRVIPKEVGMTLRNSFNDISKSLSSSQAFFSKTKAAPISIKDITEKIKNYKNSSNKERFFGIRIDYNKNWEDQELVNKVLDISTRFSLTKKIENEVLLIAAYQLHFNKDKALSILESLSFDESNSDLHKYPSIAVFEYHLMKLALSDRSVFHKAPNEFIKGSFSYLMRFEETSNNKFMNFLDELSKYLDDNEQCARVLSDSIENDYKKNSSDFISDFKNTISIKSNECYKQWSHFWRSMTVERAPWFYSKPKDARVTHFKRDYTSCANFCPFKMRVNSQFDSHIKASLLRDEGNISKVNLKVSQISKKRKSAEILFNVIEDKSDNSEDESYLSKGSSSPLRPNIILETDCELISILHSTEVKFILHPSSIILKKEEEVSRVIYLKEIQSIFLRAYLHRMTAIEIFEESGATTFINFLHIKNDAVVKKIKQLLFNSRSFNIKNTIIQTIPFKSFFQSMHYTEQWVNRQISNFDYLMLLNTMSGRSFNSSSQYPIMPWIINNYDRESLDINDSSIYRDLSKPIGSFNKEQIESLLAQYESYKETPSIGIEPFLYSSAPITPISLYLYLMRMEPFTTLHIDMQSGMFDVPQRLFRSIKSAFDSVMGNINDYRELIPEFFFQPEFLKNLNNFDLGKIDDKEVNDVILPPWAKSPIEFIYFHRKALESEYVSMHLNQWIDLIWGDKQRSYESLNVYQREMYSDIWETPKGKDIENAVAIDSVLTYVGQIPPPLFDKSHPQRNSQFQDRIQRSTENDSASLNQIPEIENKNFLLNISIEKIVASKVIQLDPKNLSFLLIDENGTIYNYLVSLTSKEVKNISKSLQINGFNDIYSHENSKFKYAFQNGNQFFAISNVENSRGIYKINISKKDANLVVKKKNEINSLAVEDEWLAISDFDSVVSLYKVSDRVKYQFSIPSFRDRIKCCAISQTFHLLVCGTRDCSLMLCSLTSKSIVNIVNLNDSKPILLLITPSWGFIVVHHKEVFEGHLRYFISVLTVNGEIITKTKIKSHITQWISFKNYKGFDYIIMSDSENKVYIFEAFYAKIEDPIFESKSKIINIEFLVQEKMAVILTSDGIISFITCDID